MFNTVFGMSYMPPGGQPPQRPQVQHPSVPQPAAGSADAFFRASLSGPQEVRFDGYTKRQKPLAKYIDHTLLVIGPDENPRDAIRRLCREARDNRFFAVCVRPDKVTLAKKELEGTGVKVATVVGFPAGKTTLAEQQMRPSIGNVPLWRKIVETRKAVSSGADEIDLVMNVRQFLQEADRPEALATTREVALIKAVAGDRLLKVILETDLLTPEQVQKATVACARAGADMIKTSTGMVQGGKGATVENVTRIKQALDTLGLKRPVGIKASGGVRTAEQARALIEAGATRLGTSNGVAILQGDTQGESDQGGY